jgi:hypothetical protein
MSHYRSWTFLRLVWNEWSTRVTGSLSAILVLLGLAISIASIFGVAIPGEAMLQFGTWAIAAVCGGQAAYSVWKRENQKVLELEKRLARLELDIQFDPENIEECSLDEGKGWKQFRLNIKNESGKTIHDCHGEIDKIESPLLARSWKEKAPLTWAYLIDITKLHLHSGESKQLNVIQIDDPKNGGSAMVRFISPANANNPAPPFDKFGEYECTLIVAAEEMNAKTVRFIFDWTGYSETSRIKNVRIAEHAAATKSTL